MRGIYPVFVFLLLSSSFDRVVLGSDPPPFVARSAYRLAFASAFVSLALTSNDRVTILVLGYLMEVPLGVEVPDVGVRVSVPIVPDGELA